jgi:hypothetical protein
VQHAGRVQRRERVGDARELLAQRAHRRHLARLDERRERPALDERHREVRSAVHLARVVDLDDVVVPHARARRGLVAEPLAGLRVGVEAVPQHLHRRAPAQRPVHRLVHHPHRAATQLAQQRVRTEVARKHLGGRRLDQVVEQRVRVGEEQELRVRLPRRSR